MASKIRPMKILKWRYIERDTKIEGIENKTNEN